MCGKCNWINTIIKEFEVLTGLPPGYAFSGHTSSSLVVIVTVAIVVVFMATIVMDTIASLNLTTGFARTCTWKRI